MKEPVVAAFIRAAAALAVAVGVDLPEGWQEAAINFGSAAFIVWSVLRARSRVTPTGRSSDGR